jgi:hypothetical protein
MSSQLARNFELNGGETTIGDSTDYDAIQMEKKRLDALKPAGPKKSDMMVRVTSGFFVAATYILTYHLGVLYQCLFI